MEIILNSHLSTFPLKECKVILFYITWHDSRNAKKKWSTYHVPDIVLGIQKSHISIIFTELRNNSYKQFLTGYSCDL